MCRETIVLSAVLVVNNNKGKKTNSTIVCARFIQNILRVPLADIKLLIAALPYFFQSMIYLINQQTV